MSPRSTIINNREIRIIGIDPGSRVTGYGIISKIGPQIGFVTCGTVRTDSKTAFSLRLLEIHEGLSEVISHYQPDTAAVEDMFVSRNPNTALKLGQARGVAILAALQAGISVQDYAARFIKQMVTGYGNADKDQVRNMVRDLLELNNLPSSDAADGLAAAICHAYQMGLPFSAAS
ncbi:MAG: crossover junction endodeoxyribonuclease RuvC [Desulfobulbaceae bacterium]|nr:crossover junction endodeoxyribonuclease RuvC [Desulfobulbaceae bacterium]